jgi:hypothetical protein
MPRSLRRLILSVLFSVVAVAVYVFFGLYLLVGLILLNVVCWALSPVARGRGWGSEGRLTAHLSRPPIADEAKRSAQPMPNLPNPPGLPNARVD